MNKIEIQKIFDKCDNKKVAVIGDVMLDRYFWGKVKRVSPEAPVPVVDFEKETNHLGGAANVAKNLKFLGINPILFGVLGDDEAGKTFLKYATENGISTDGLFIDKSRPTTLKTRLIGNNQHIARLDNECRNSINSDTSNHIINVVTSIKDLSAIIFEDYDKGVISQELISKIMLHANTNNIPVFVDPKLNNFFLYKGTTLFKPNKKEAAEALQVNINNLDDVKEAGKKLIQRLECQNVLITLGSKGMMLINKNNDTIHIPAKAKRVADVSGAGDTVIATLTAAFCGGACMETAAELANYASGIAVVEPGIVAIKKETLLSKIK